MQGEKERFTGFTEAEDAKLRELFVRDRFSEPIHFGRPDIQEWLGTQDVRRCEESVVGRWRELASLAGMSVPTAEEGNRMLRLFGTCYPSDPIIWPKDFFPEEYAITTFLKTISADLAVRVYVTHRSVIVFVVDAGRAKALVFESTVDGKAGQWLGHGVFLSTILHSALLKWQYHPSADSAAAAGQFVRDTVSRYVQVVRKKAEADFHSAVAVCFDGTRIVTVDEVWVDSGPNAQEQRITIHPASSFFDRKIYLNMGVYRGVGSFDSKEELLRFLNQESEEKPDTRFQFFCGIEGKKVFLTSEFYAPMLEATT